MFEQEINLSDHYGMIVPPKLVNDTYPSIHTRSDCGGRQDSNRYCRSISGRSSVLISSRGRRHRWKKFTHVCHLDNQADGRGYILCDIRISPLGLAQNSQDFVPRILDLLCFTYFLCHGNVVDLDPGSPYEAVSSSQVASMRM